MKDCFKSWQIIFMRERLGVKHYFSHFDRTCSDVETFVDYSGHFRLLDDIPDYTANK